VSSSSSWLGRIGKGKIQLLLLRTENTTTPFHIKDRKRWLSYRDFFPQDELTESMACRKVAFARRFKKGENWVRVECGSYSAGRRTMGWTSPLRWSRCCLPRIHRPVRPVPSWSMRSTARWTRLPPPARSHPLKHDNAGVASQLMSIAGLARLFRRADSVQVKWLIRLIRRDLRTPYHARDHHAPILSCPIARQSRHLQLSPLRPATSERSWW
jgi:hypothetical protein